MIRFIASAEVNISTPIDEPIDIFYTHTSIRNYIVLNDDDDDLQHGFLAELVNMLSKSSPAARAVYSSVSKSAFNHLLLDPRVIRNLPARAKMTGITKPEMLRDFCCAIFYVSKGYRSRHLEHLNNSLVS
jgi:hypothetical protein